MAIDNTPPRLKLIVTIAVITVVTLVSLDFVFKSYYAMMTDEARREKVAPTRDKDEQRKAEALALANAGITIQTAMDTVAKGTRPEAISPQASEDLSPMTGWVKSPKPAPTRAPKGGGGGEPAMMGDGGSPMMADGGMGATAGDGGATALAADAGAPAPAAKDGGAHAAPAPTPHNLQDHAPVAPQPAPGH